MKKCIVVLDGNSEAKNKFTQLAMTPRDGFPEGIWSWQINATNVLSVSLRSMGWDGKTKDDKHYECLTEMMSLVNEYYDFKNSYYDMMIKKFNVHPKAQLLVIHNAGEEAEEVLKENEDEQEIFFVNLIRDEKQSSDKYDMNIVFGDNFETEVYRLFDVLLKEKEIKVNVQ